MNSTFESLRLAATSYLTYERLDRLQKVRPLTLAEQFELAAAGLHLIALSSVAIGIAAERLLSPR